MCGILAFSSHADKQCNIDKIKMLFMFNQERGKESYGYYTPESGVVKDTGKIEEYLIKKDSKVPESNLFIGHVRASSVGAINKNNAHPFNYGNIVLAMNGTLSNHYDLMKDYGFLWKDFDVDSQILTAMINKDQNKSALSKILGSCAVVYTDTNTGALYCYRNADRPLFRGNFDECMYISSVENSLKMIGCSDVKEFKEDNLYEIKEGKITGTFKVKRAVVEVKVVKQLPVHNVEVDRRTFRYIDYDTTKSEDLIGEFLTPKQTLNLNNGGTFLEGFAYEIIGASISNMYEVYAVDNFNQTKSISKHLFKSCVPIIFANSYVFATSKVRYNDVMKSIFCEIGDLMLVTFVKKDLYVCRNLKNQSIASIDKTACRFALKDEVVEYKSSFRIQDNINDIDDYTHNMFGYPDFNEQTLSAEREKVLANMFPVKIEKPFKLTEEETYRENLVITSMETFEDLAQFTIDALQEQITDIQECAKSPKINTKINIMNILISNYTEKALMLVK